MRLLLTYQQYVTMDNFDSLRAQEFWFLEQIAQVDEKYLPDNSSFVLEQIEEFIQDTRMELNEIQMYLDGDM